MMKSRGQLTRVPYFVWNHNKAVLTFSASSSGCYRLEMDEIIWLIYQHKKTCGHIHLVRRNSLLVVLWAKIQVISRRQNNERRREWAGFINWHLAMWHISLYFVVVTATVLGWQHCFSTFLSHQMTSPHIELQSCSKHLQLFLAVSRKGGF